MYKRISIRHTENNGVKVAKGKEDDNEKEIDWIVSFMCETQGSEKLQCDARSISASQA